jgi:hypothetical protein
MRRAGHNVLPTRVNLLKRKIVEVAICPCCESAEENLIRAIWTCPAAHDVWGSKLSHFQKCSWEVLNFMGLFEHCVQRFSKENIELMTVVARAIWFRRNKYVFEGEFAHTDDLYTSAVQLLSIKLACRWTSPCSRYWQMGLPAMRMQYGALPTLVL